MYKEMTITEARQALTSLPELFEKNPGTVAVTRRGKQVLAVLPWELYESIMETMNILGDAELMAAIRQGMKDIEAGRTVSLEEFERRLKL
ncbi:MAG TPA: type II toxin-antitoxin system Phd/YefM family antitoxin [bacterium]|jgi:PHD/YefM family antitoxin component YafN of YafNO toxin-antitoxin module